MGGPVNLPLLLADLLGGAVRLGLGLGALAALLAVGAATVAEGVSAAGPARRAALAGLGLCAVLVCNPIIGTPLRSAAATPPPILLAGYALLAYAACYLLVALWVARVRRAYGARPDQPEPAVPAEPSPERP